MFKYLGAGFAGLMVVYLIVSVLDFNTNAILTLNKNSIAGIEGMDRVLDRSPLEPLIDWHFLVVIDNHVVRYMY